MRKPLFRRCPNKSARRFAKAQNAYIFRSWRQRHHNQRARGRPSGRPRSSPNSDTPNTGASLLVVRKTDELRHDNGDDIAQPVASLTFGIRDVAQIVTRRFSGTTKSSTRPGRRCRDAIILLHSPARGRIADKVTGADGEMSDYLIRARLSTRAICRNSRTRISDSGPDRLELSRVPCWLGHRRSGPAMLLLRT